MEFKILNGAADDLRDARTVRDAVFVKEQGFSPEIEFDHYDKTAAHIVGYEHGIPVCTARIFVEDGARPGFYHIGRVCVQKAARGKGFGEKVMRETLFQAKKAGALGVELGAQLTAEGFYEKLGFRRYGELFYDEAVPHIMMELKF